MKAIYNFKDQITQNLSSNLSSTEVLEAIISSPNSPIKNQVDLIRRGNNLLKQNLPVYYFNCCFNNLEANYSNIQNLTGEIFLDIDKLLTLEILQETKQKISKLDFVKACWISSSGLGLHIVVSVKGLSIDNFESTFDYLNTTYFDSMLDIKCRNINRATFLSYDEKAYINNNPKALNIEVVVSTNIPSININNIVSNSTLYSANYNSIDSSEFKRVRCTLEFIPKEAMDECFGKEKVIFEHPIQFFTYYRKSVKVGNRNNTLRAIAAQLMTQNKHFTLGNLLFWLDNFNESHKLFQTRESINGIGVQIFKQIERGTFKEVKGILKSGMIHPQIKGTYTQKEKRAFAAECSAKTKKSKTEAAIHNALEDLFSEGKLITIENLAIRIGKSYFGTQRYYKQFKEQIRIMNEDIKQR